VLSGRGLCNELITCPEESYRLCCVVVCDLETSRMRRPWPALGYSATVKKKIFDSVKDNERDDDKRRKNNRLEGHFTFRTSTWGPSKHQFVGLPLVW
jgi:hypothetical protein